MDKKKVLAINSSKRKQNTYGLLEQLQRIRQGDRDLSDLYIRTLDPWSALRSQLYRTCPLMEGPVPF